MAYRPKAVYKGKRRQPHGGIRCLISIGSVNWVSQRGLLSAVLQYLDCGSQPQKEEVVKERTRSWRLVLDMFSCVFVFLAQHGEWERKERPAEVTFAIPNWTESPQLLDENYI